MESVPPGPTTGRCRSRRGWDTEIVVAVVGAPGADLARPGGGVNVTLGTGTVVAGTVVTAPVVTGTVEAGTVVTGTVVAGTVVTGEPFAGSSEQSTNA